MAFLQMADFSTDAMPMPKASTHRKVDRVKTRRNIEEWLRKQATEEDMAHIADERGIKIAYVQQEKNERPCFGPNQVRSRCQIKAGLQYKLFFQGSTSTWLVTKEPYRKNDRSWWIETQEINEWGNHWGNPQDAKTEFGLDFLGIHPHPNGVWTTQVYLAFTQESKSLKCLCPDHHPCCN